MLVIQSKKTETKINDTDQYITTLEFNKLTTKKFAARLAEANLGSENDIGNFVKKTYFDDKPKTLNKKVTSNKTKDLLVKYGLKKTTNI